MTDRELIQQALEALNHVNVQDRVQIIAALRERLAQPVQEPVAEVRLIRTGGNAGLATHIVQIVEGYFPAGTKLYTSPQQHIEHCIWARSGNRPCPHVQSPKPLTDEQIEQCMKQAYATAQGRNLEHAFARAIEAAHGITREQS